MTKLDRTLQRTLLHILAERYPQQTEAKTLVQQTQQDLETVEANVAYMSSHGLVLADWFTTNKPCATLLRAQLTAKGCDFLADDGGLSAILGVVTIKIHEDTIKDVLENFIATSDLPHDDKNRWQSQLQSLPVDATRHAVLKLLDLALGKVPEALSVIGKALGMSHGA